MTGKIIPAAAFCLLGAALLNPPAAPGANGRDELSLYFSEEDMVEATTRASRPMNQVAENVSIVTREEIRRMNARSVAEILNRVPGVFVQFGGRDFNSINDFSIQDSSFHHVLVLVDGVRWNFDLEGMAVTNSIPVEIIERLEVIKGPASSTWGSALGGVVNIITRKTGSTSLPHGTLYASYGESNSQHYSATVRGKAGEAGYFLSAASQSSDGIRLNRAYDDESVYAKVDLALPGATQLTVTAGSSNPLTDFGEVFPYNYAIHHKDYWLTAVLDTSFGEGASLHFSGFKKRQKFLYPPFPNYYDAETTGAASRLDLILPGHQLTLGAEIDRVEGVSSDPDSTGHEESWGIYLNDTVSLGDFSITPGIRYDHLSLTDSQVSPSLGATWQFSDATLVRALVARGFRKPYMNDQTPDLVPENVISYQAGLETTALPGLIIKLDLFQHDVKDTWEYNYTTWELHNAGEIKRYGYELEAATNPLDHFSLDGSFTYIYTDYHGSGDSDDMYSGKLTLLYDNPQLFTAELFGQYIWWNEDKVTISQPHQDGSLICELNCSKTIRISEGTSLELFATVHNLFNGSHNWAATYYPNAPRWLEAGLRLHF